jgi:hypothetical protein
VEPRVLTVFVTLVHEPAATANMISIASAPIASSPSPFKPRNVAITRSAVRLLPSLKGSFATRPKHASRTGSTLPA